MKNELRDPLEKLSKSLRRAVSINKSKETDLKATMNTIQRERRRSFNAWSMRKEKFLRAKQNRMPVLHFEQATLPQRTKTDNSHNTKSEERHINLVRAVDPVNMTGIDRNKSPGLKNHGGRLTTNKNDGMRKQNSLLEVLPPLTTLANSNLFFLERERLHRNRHRQHFSTVANGIKCREFRGQKVVTTIESVEVENFNSEGDVCLSHPSDKDFLPTIATADQDEKRETAKEQWENVRYPLGDISEKRHKNNLSMFDLTKLFSEIRQCRYLRTGKESTSENQQADYTIKCTCVACTIKDKHKLKNNLGAPW